MDCISLKFDRYPPSTVFAQEPSPSLSTFLVLPLLPYVVCEFFTTSRDGRFCFQHCRVSCVFTSLLHAWISEYGGGLQLWQIAYLLKTRCTLFRVTSRHLSAAHDSSVMTSFKYLSASPNWIGRCEAVFTNVQACIDHLWYFSRLIKMAPPRYHEVAFIGYQLLYTGNFSDVVQPSLQASRS